MIGHSKPEATDPLTQRLQNALSMIGSPHKFFWCGKVGSGLAAKISNNYLSCSIIIAVAEAMAIGVRLGVDPKLFQDVIHNSTGQSFMGDNVCPVPGVVPHAPSSNNWKLGFKTQMMIKDIGLAVEAGKQVGIKPRIAETALDLWRKCAKDPRCIDKDGSSVWLYINDEPDEEKGI
jgi:3-hydroxyisobutyrate/3-hydroxypropionate dehydrogenase